VVFEVGGGGPIPVILPDIGELLESTIDTRSPIATAGKLGPTGTVTIGVVVVTWTGTSSGCAGCPGKTLALPIRTGPGRKTT
jgi:hypothetical protein